MTTDIAGKTDLLAAMVLQPDGRIVVVGRVAPDGGSDPDTGVVRYRPAGSRTESFGTHGILRLPLSSWDEATGVVLQPDGKLLVSVESVVGVTFDFVVARLTTVGRWTPPSAPGESPSTDFTGDHDVVNGLASAGRREHRPRRPELQYQRPDFGLVRFTSTGALDTGWDRRQVHPSTSSASTQPPAWPSRPTGASWSAGLREERRPPASGLVRIVP